MAEILQLSNKMAGNIEDWEEFNRLLNVRQQYIEKIDQLDRQMQRLQQMIKDQAGVGDWPGLKKLHPQRASAIEAVQSNIGQMALKAKELTDQAGRLAKQRMNELKQKMQNMQASKAGMAAYRKKGAQHDGYFIDKKK